MAWRVYSFHKVHNQITIRNFEEKDCLIIAEAFQAQGWNKELEQYQDYLEDQQNGVRDVLVADCDNEFAGYLTIRWESEYPPFQTEAIPEVVDFNVLIKYWRRGIGSKLMDGAEESVSKKSNRVGIGVGLFSDYGNAQRLYVKRGYIPDGRGIYKDGRFARYGDDVTLDDNLVLYFTKELK